MLSHNFQKSQPSKCVTVQNYWLSVVKQEGKALESPREMLFGLICRLVGLLWGVIYFTSNVLKIARTRYGYDNHTGNANIDIIKNSDAVINLKTSSASPCFVSFFVHSCLFKAVFCVNS